jgi:Beta-propeller repeat/HYDIN/CFA65/VesB-like, Ig-like domain
VRLTSTNTRSGGSTTMARFFIAVLSMAVVGLWTLKASWVARSRAQSSGPAGHVLRLRAQPLVQYARLPMGFERNEGETDGRVKYMARGAGYTLFLTAEGAVLRLGGGKGKGTGEVVGLKLVGANGQAAVKGEGELEGKANYFIGRDPGKWRREVAEYRRVRYEGVYPGIDLVYYGNQEQLEYDFEVGVGRDASEIGLRVEGAGKVEVEGDGELVVKGEGGEVRLRRPEAYQEGGGKREKVEARYAVKGNEVGFEIGAYDRSRRLVIDPVLTYATYLGGTGGDVANGIAVDASGNAYITGTTNSSTFPTLVGEQTGIAGSSDAFVTKLNATGSALVYSTFLGGAGSDMATGIAVSSSGDAYVVGTTTSSNFPTTTGAFQTIYGGNGDAFVTQLNSSGNAIVYSSYLGGHGADFGQAIAVDTSGNAYVTGSTQSNDFPAVNALQATPAGGSDAFVAKVNFDGSALLYSTYLGGFDADFGQGIKVDSSGNAYVTGYTFSPNFPTSSPFQGANAGAPDAFVSKIDSTGSALVFSTYLGGSGDDRGFGIAIDSAGDVYIAGQSQSADFPTTFTAFQVQSAGAGDAFVAKLNPSGLNLVYSTYLGGAGVDQATAIAVDPSGDAFVTGITHSNDFPTVLPVQSLFGGNGGSSCGSLQCPDAFVTQLNPAGTGLNYSTYLGGNGADFGQAIALDPSNIPYVAGSTASANFPVIATAYSGVLGGVAGNVFAAKLAPDNLPGMAIVPARVNFGGQTLDVRSSLQSVSLINAGTAPLSITAIAISPVSTTEGITTATDFTESDDCVGTIAAGGGSCTINIAFTPSTPGLETGQISITDDAANSPHTINLSGTGSGAATAVTVTPTNLQFGNQNVGSVSATQTVTITNTGTATLSISSITANGDYLQTNTCGALLNLLNVGQSCTVTVSFQPTASGVRSGTVSISDNASGSPQTVTLSGTGVAVFTVSSTAPTSTIVVGTTTATFPIAASAPSTFTGNITLTCPATLTCSFSPATIFAGQTSTLTVSNLTAALTNPYNFNVTGVSGSQSNTVALTILLADYSLSVSPALDTIVSGSPAGYTVTLTPSNGFSSSVQFTCSNIPVGATCTFSPASVTPSGSATSVKMTVSTTKSSAISVWPRSPFHGLPPPMMWLAWLAALAIAVLLWERQRFGPTAGVHSRILSARFVGLIVALALLSSLSACRPVNSNAGPTLTGNYTITITGTLTSNTAVTRTATCNLSVT